MLTFLQSLNYSKNVLPEYRMRLRNTSVIEVELNVFIMHAGERINSTFLVVEKYAYVILALMD